jgi:hypothetical protein
MAKKRPPAGGFTNTFDTVREMGLALPRVEEGTAYGSPALKVGGQMFTCLPTNRSAEPDSLAVRIAFRDRDELLAADPAAFYLPEHYVNYPCVLVRLRRIHPDALRDLLRMAWTFVSERPARRRPRAAAARRAR